MADLTLNVIGADQPGIVAAVTGALVDVGGNVAACRAALLSGSFAMVLAVSVPDDVTPEDVEAALVPTAAALGLTIDANVCPHEGPDEQGERCVVSVYGADRPGIVHDAAGALAELGAGIVDLTSSLVGDPPIFILGMEVILPGGVTLGRVESVLGSGVLRDLEVSVQPAAVRI